jgi:hypothetical protein
MSATAALPRDSGNNAAKTKTNNALTTEFFFDTAAANFGSNEDTSSKDISARKIQRPPHSSLLATPLNRLSGGQVKKKPSPSILESKYLCRPTAPTPLTTKPTPDPLSAGKGAAASPSYSTPLSKTFAAAATAASTVQTCTTVSRTTPPPFSSSLVSASSDIKARLRHLAATTPITTIGGSSQSHSRSTPLATAPMSSSLFSTSRDFRISATSGSTPYSAESLSAQSRANQLQSELQLRDLKVHKLAAAVAEARKERDAQKLRADKLEAIATISNTPIGVENSSPYAATYSTRTRNASFYQNQIPRKQAQQASSSSPSRSNAPTRNPSQVPSDAQAVVSELRKEAETLRQQVEMAASELQGQRARADAAEEKARYAEARAEAESSAFKANENEFCSLQQKVTSMQNEVRRLAKDLAIAEDRAGLAETSLAEERNRSRGGGGGTGSNSASKNISNSSALTEVALTAQVRALATQLKVAKSEAVTAQHELTALKAETQGNAAAHEGATASILSANRELEATLAQASHTIETRDEELEQAKGAVAQLAAENAALHAALKDRDEHYAALERRSNNDNAQGFESNARANAAEAKLAAAQQELKAAKVIIADLEHAMSKNIQTSSGGFHSTSSTGPSPLRDIVGSLRTELEDRELRLAAAEEELATERRRAADLHRQVLDQAVEIDDLQRETHQSDDVLTKELHQARKEAHAAAQELAEWREQQQRQRQDALAVGGAATGNATEVEVELKRERDGLREELDARESEVMALQGQLHMLVNLNNSNGRGSLGEGGEAENWLI